MKKKSIAWGLGVFVLFIAIGLLWTFEIIPGRSELRVSLAEILTEVSAADGSTQKEPIASDTVIYVLGGSQDSLKARFETVAELCIKDSCRKILLLSRPGITAYDLSLGRNLTNDEWAIKRLSGLGVNRETLELISFKDGLFGTLTEAQGLAEIAETRGYKRIILITSRCHTKRAWVTFSKAFKKTNVEISIVAARDSARLRSLIYEYLKFVLYRDIVLPNYVDNKQAAARLTVLTALQDGHASIRTRDAIMKSHPELAVPLVGTGASCG